MNLSRFDKKNREPENVLTEKPITNGITDIKSEDTSVVVYLSGKIDASNFEEIQSRAFEQLKNDNVKLFVFDMNDVNYVSSAGLRMFSAVNHKVTEAGAKYKLTQMREDIMKLFQMTGYASAFCIELKND